MKWQLSSLNISDLSLFCLSHLCTARWRTHVSFCRGLLEYLNLNFYIPNTIQIRLQHNKAGMKNKSILCGDILTGSHKGCICPFLLIPSFFHFLSKSGKLLNHRTAIWLHYFSFWLGLKWHRRNKTGVNLLICSLPVYSLAPEQMINQFSRCPHPPPTGNLCDCQ